MEKRKVSKEEFEQFIKEYPNSLQTNITAIFEPPLKTWNDFKKSDKWPDSVVAFHYVQDDPKDFYIFDSKN